MNDTSYNRQRIHIDVSGSVQGVGFRPFVYRLATRLGLAGYVLNEPSGVEIEIEGGADATDTFLEALRQGPPLARIRAVETREIAPRGDAEFTIRGSQSQGAPTVFIAPDIATCEDCLRELRDPADRRYRYPFINCTNCGPRYTIIRDVPYDRANTTMARFEMCPACRAEYADPGNRRFHAEPTCCPECGPSVTLAGPGGAPLPCPDPIEAAVERLEQGAIVAVKGLGGFHLACDASNVSAVRQLRKRKHRDLKPFALMVRDLAGLERFCLIPEGYPDTLLGKERPILLLPKREDHGLAEEVAPRAPSFGVMLPYTPLHHLLLEGGCPALVMTSGNLGSEPIACTNKDAVMRLKGLADCFLLHDRDIHVRTDDSVARVIRGGLRFLRRSRGYAPFPVGLPVGTPKGEILAVGPELNNTVCMTREGQAFLSHHLGDLENVPAYEGFLQAIGHLKAVLGVEPRTIACDLHPDYLATRHARETGLPLEPVQHHHAHIASVLAESDRVDRVIGVAYDGMGWGDDGRPWGGEFLMCDLLDYERCGCIEPVAQPGGDAAAKHPPRMAYAHLLQTFGEEADAVAQELLPSITAEERGVLARMVARGLNSPMTSSIGRLFDAASALLGICDHNTHHAQAPMELEAAANRAPGQTGFYQAPVAESESGMPLVRCSQLLADMVGDFRGGVSADACAARFHESVARLTLDMCTRIRNNTGLETVALSGGVFANALLTERVAALLVTAGFEVLLNSEVPAGDGGVSLGQAAVAAARAQARNEERPQGD